MSTRKIKKRLSKLKQRIDLAGFAIDQISVSAHLRD